MGKSFEMTPLSSEALMGRRVLVADEVAPTRWSYVGLLRDAGARVTEARDGVEALRLARAQRPDLILADMALPGLDGLGLCAALREEPLLEDLAVVLLSDGEPPQAIWGSDAGSRPLVSAVLDVLDRHEVAPEAGPAPFEVPAPEPPQEVERAAAVITDAVERENMRAQSTVAMYRDPPNHVSHAVEPVWRLRTSAAARADGSASGFAWELQAMSRILGLGFVVLLGATVGLIAWRVALSTDGMQAFPPAAREGRTVEPDAPAPEAEPELPKATGLTAFSGALHPGIDIELGASAGQGALVLEGPGEASVAIDGVDHGELPVSVTLEEGRHLVRYRFEDGVTDRFYYVKAGATRVLRVITRPGGFVDAR